MTTVFRSIEYTATSSATGIENAFSYSDSLFSDANLAQEIRPYAAMFELARVRKFALEFWSNDNDDITTPNLAYPRLQYWYDADCQNRTMTLGSLQCQPGFRETFLKPMEKRYVSFQPKFNMALYSGKIGAVGPLTFGIGKNPYRQVQDYLDAQSFVSENAMQTALYGSSATEVRYRIHLTMDFKNKARNRVYV